MCTKSMRLQEGTVIREVHYTGPCTVIFEWAPTGAEPSIVIEVSTSYAKFMWSLPK